MIQCSTFSIADNFYAKVLGENDKYHIERYNNQSDKLQPATGGAGVCHQAIPVSSTMTIWEAEYDSTSGDSQTGIKLFTTNISDNTKWYLRVPLDGQPELVCQDHMNVVSIASHWGI